MDISVIIPTYRRPDKLAACVRALAGQSLDPARFEVLVGTDGPDEVSLAAARDAWGSCRAALVPESCPRSGLNAVRNAILRKARGRFLLSLNDDVIPCPTLVETHLREQLAATDRGNPAIISGYSPWKQWADPTLFDLLVARTSMIFFYDQMTPDKVIAAGPLHDWGFRHCYGLNFSVPLHMVRDSGGFIAFPLAYGYDDIELAFRLNHRHRTPVLYRPEAAAVHDHRYRAQETLSREFKLGHAAWHFAGRDPAFCEAVFRRDIRSRAELEYSEQYLHRERGTAAMVRETFLKLDTMPPETIAGSLAAGADILHMLYLHHLPLKRWMWRAGLVAASRDKSQEDVVYPMAT